MKATIIKPPTRLPLELGRSVFLAGSIEQDIASRWQSVMETMLSDTPITILNPRRDAWDASWEQSIDSPHFREQVEWELTGMHHADLIAMYFDPNTKSPITLMELGLHASDCFKFESPKRSKRNRNSFVQFISPILQRVFPNLGLSKVIVCCPDGFWRKGNVDIVCDRYGVDQVPTLTALAKAVRTRLAV